MLSYRLSISNVLKLKISIRKIQIVLNLFNFNFLVANKMKTLTYQLSNLKFVEEGWTLQRPPDLDISSDDDSDMDEDILVPRDMSMSAIKVNLNMNLKP